MLRANLNLRQIKCSEKGTEQNKADPPLLMAFSSSFHDDLSLSLSFPEIPTEQEKVLRKVRAWEDQAAYKLALVK